MPILIDSSFILSFFFSVPVMYCRGKCIVFFCVIFVGVNQFYDGQIAKSRRSMNHAEVVIARRAVEEGRGLVVIVNKMDLLKGKLHENVVKAVPEEVQTVLPQVCWFKTFKVAMLFIHGHSLSVHLPGDSYFLSMNVQYIAPLALAEDGRIVGCTIE